ncbi:MAG: hypothetical protein ACK5PS_01340 [Desulfopila sp.]
MKPTDKSSGYPIFEVNQILSSSHLNQVFAYLDEQQRLSRADLVGIGILCGLGVRGEQSGDKVGIHLQKGCGVTSEGYLVVQPAAVELVAYRAYRLPAEPVYAPFYQGAGQQYPLWELFAAGEPDTTPLAEPADFLVGKALLLFLELAREGVRNCSPASCDDRGARIGATVRRLLVRTEDLEAIVAAAATAEAGLFPDDLAATVRAEPEPVELRVPRFDVPASDLLTTTALLQRFLAMQQNGGTGLAEAIGTMLGEAYQRFRPLLAESYPTDPFVGFSQKFSVTETEASGPRLASLQYYGDFFADLLQGAEEFRHQGAELLCACCPPQGLFPRHLMLGLTDPAAENDDSYRQRFLPSPAFGRCGEQVADLRQLFGRLVAMVRAFAAFLANPSLATVPPYSSLPGADPQIRLTPSVAGDASLSARAIPFYYLQNGSLPLYTLWSIEKSRDNRARENLSYRCSEYAPPPPDFVANPLAYDLRPFDFLRVEGHLGKPYQQVLDTLELLKKRYRLPIECVVVRTGGEESGQLARLLHDHPGIRHGAGVALGGTLVLVCHHNGKELPGAKAAVEDAIADGQVIADFFLPYPLHPTIAAKPLTACECEIGWIDTIRHLHNLSLRQYRPIATAKAPAANEQEGWRLRDHYVIRIYRYEIQGISMLTGKEGVDVAVPLDQLRTGQLAAVARALNERFPFGLVFDHRSGTGNLLLRHLQGHRFRLELGGIQGNQIRYAWENDRVSRYQHGRWQTLHAGSDGDCRPLAGEYREKEYQWLHEQYPPRYPAPVFTTTAKEVITWERTILARARKYTLDTLPIAPLLAKIVKEIQEIEPAAQVVLVGGWANGSWVSRFAAENVESLGSEEEVKNFLQLREKVTGKRGGSGINLLVASENEISPAMLKTVTGYSIAIFTGKADAQKGLVLT